MYLILLLLLLGVESKINAQTYVTIPDPGFVQYLQQNFGSCMNGSKLDTNLINLECIGNQLTSIPELPLLLDTLSCENNQSAALPAITHI